MRIIRVLITTLNLKFFITDILKEQRNPTFTTFKKTYVYRVNRLSRDPIYQNKDLKRTESFRLSNRCRKPDRGSNHNMYSDDDEEAFKDVEIKLEPDLDLEPESFTCVVGDFDLDNNKSSCFISLWSFRNSIRSFETEGGYFAVFNKSKKLLKRSSNRPDLLLYDISITDHIVNNKK